MQSKPFYGIFSIESTFLRFSNDIEVTDITSRPFDGM